MKSSTIGALALALLVSPLAVSASPSLRPSAQADNHLVLVAAKGGPGSCGKMMYWSAKDGKCLDYREKSAEKAAPGEPPSWVGGCMRGRSGC
jgi:hypothetical protein